LLLTPTDDSLFEVRAQIYLAQKDYADALADIDAALAHIPADSTGVQAVVAKGREGL